MVNNLRDSNPDNSNKKKKNKRNSKQLNKKPDLSQQLQNRLAQTQTAQKLKQIAEKKERRKAKQAIATAAGAAGGPMAKIAAKALLSTKAGDRYADAYKNGFTPAEKLSNVKKEIKKDLKKIKIIVTFAGFFLIMIALIFLISFFFKSVDSQTFSNENGGTVKSDKYIDDKTVNIFANYPGLYEKIVEKVKNVSDQYDIEIDKYLVIATLVEPISNELIIPVDDHSCGEENCYYFKGESKTWSEFLSSWADQAELLSKMQIMTYINNENEIKVNCGPEQTMEQYAQNDLETNTFPWYGWLNPVNWFKGFRDAAAAEVNAKCVDARNGASKVPTVRVLSIEQGDYYYTNNADREYEFVKDPNSGGVYFWNLVNKNGFLHEYLKDYLSNEYSDDPDKNYEINKKTIVDTANEIYSYYETIRKDCNGYPVMKGELKKINFREDPNSPIYSLDFEEVFIGGNLLATYPGAKGEVAKAQAILTRSEAYYNIVEEGADHITGTVIMGCWWWKYNPTYDPKYEDQKDNPNYDPNYPKEHFPEIYKAVTETRGIVVTSYGGTNVLNTQFDSFCPTTRDAQGGFYYLPDGQRKLPIETSKFSVPKSRTECPCFQNKSSQPGTVFSDSFSDLLMKKVGTPAQTTTEKCWESSGTSKVDENGNVLQGYKYKTTGGHGQGVSQHGMAYFSQFGYSHLGLIKLFLDRDNKGVSFKRYDGSIQEGECRNYGYFNQEEDVGTGYSGSSEYEGGNYTEGFGGRPLDKPLDQALAAKGHSLKDLVDCMQERIQKAGPGTRAGVVEAGVGLIQCTSDLTGGYTYPYNHSGADPGAMSGLINPKWGYPGGSCPLGNCRLGLNCATFVRTSFCNGGMNLCDRGSRFAHEMFDKTYFPEATKVMIGPGFRYVFGNIPVSSPEEAFNLIKPGDMLYSEHFPRIEEKDHGNHVMLVVGKTDDSITIAENGRDMRVISRSELLSSRRLQYGVLLLDEYYANSSNVKPQKLA